MRTHRSGIAADVCRYSADRQCELVRTLLALFSPLFVSPGPFAILALRRAHIKHFSPMRIDSTRIIKKNIDRYAFYERI